MIHFNENCENNSNYEKTGICTLCAIFDHQDFIRRKPPRNGIYEIIRYELDNGKKWRIGKRPNRECGHPGVKNSAGKCVFCIMEQRLSVPNPCRNAPITPTDNLQHALNRTQKQIAELQKYEETLRTYIAFGVTEAPQPPQIESPRQIAVREGNKWYIPTEPCPRCHTLSERYVLNGRCRGCK